MTINHIVRSVFLSPDNAVASGKDTKKVECRMFLAEKYFCNPPFLCIFAFALNGEICAVIS